MIGDTSSAVQFDPSMRIAHDIRVLDSPQLTQELPSIIYCNMTMLNVISGLIEQTRADMRLTEQSLRDQMSMQITEMGLSELETIALMTSDSLKYLVSAHSRLFSSQVALAAYYDKTLKRYRNKVASELSGKVIEFARNPEYPPFFVMRDGRLEPQTTLFVSGHYRDYMPRTAQIKIRLEHSQESLVVNLDPSQPLRDNESYPGVQADEFPPKR